ncbi:MAG: ATP-binding cassette domain-containing protein [Geobacter sp.]|nr:ATP-binding cassette domain-containing protein [Geobacter sp.]
MPNLLSIKNLRVSFPSPTGSVEAVRDVSLSLDKGSVLALVGESGSGKSMTAFSIMRLVPTPGLVTADEILFEDQNLIDCSEDTMRSIRGRRISMIFQEPMTSLNPVLKIGDQISEPLLLHNKLSRKEAAGQSEELLTKVGITSAGDRMRDYPHQLSGGMRQRVMIAMALACHPALLIADEPTTALDVTIQAQILELLDELRTTTGMGLLLITHDLGIVADRSNFTAVMYAGQIVESAPTGILLCGPKHPYTKALLASLPQYSEPGKPLATLTSQITANPSNYSGCLFALRCPIASTECFSNPQELREISPSHKVRCWKSI